MQSTSPLAQADTTGARRPTSRARRAAAEEAARDFDGVVSRRTLRRLGIQRGFVARQVAQDRWRTHGHETVAVSTAALTERADRARVVWELGVDVAVLDGVTSLIMAGLTGFDETSVRVSVLHEAHPVKVPGASVRQVVRRVPGEVIGGVLPRARAPIAAIRAAAWAVSDRQATLILCLVVQQRLCTVDQLEFALSRVSTRRRRSVIRSVLVELGGGVRALGELDFAVLCRRYGLPEPLRQEVVVTGDGRCYLDVRWRDSALVVEIDGAQHHQGLAATDDALRQNDVVLTGDRVLRMTNIGLRLHADRFMEQVRLGHARFRTDATGE